MYRFNKPSSGSLLLYFALTKHKNKHIKLPDDGLLNRNI